MYLMFCQLLLQFSRPIWDVHSVLAGLFRESSELGPVVDKVDISGTIPMIIEDPRLLEVDGLYSPILLHPRIWRTLGHLSTLSTTGPTLLDQLR